MLLDHGQKVISLKQVHFDSAMPMTMRESRLQWDELMHKDLDTLLVWRTKFKQSLEGRTETKRRPGGMNVYEAWLSNKVSDRIHRLTSSESRPCAVNRIGEVKVYKNGMLPVTTSKRTRKIAAQERAQKFENWKQTAKKAEAREEAKLRYERSERRTPMNWTELLHQAGIPDSPGRAEAIQRLKARPPRPKRKKGKK